MRKIALIAALLFLAGCDCEKRSRAPTIRMRCFDDKGAVKFDRAVYLARPVTENGMKGARDVWEYQTSEMAPFGTSFFTNGPCETTENTNVPSRAPANR